MRVTSWIIKLGWISNLARIIISTAIWYRVICDPLYLLWYSWWFDQHFAHYRLIFYLFDLCWENNHHGTFLALRKKNTVFVIVLVTVGTAGSLDIYFVTCSPCNVITTQYVPSNADLRCHPLVVCEFTAFSPQRVKRILAGSRDTEHGQPCPLPPNGVWTTRQCLSSFNVFFTRSTLGLCCEHSEGSYCEGGRASTLRGVLVVEGCNRQKLYQINFKL